MAPPEGPAALLGDAHLRENDPEVEAFVAFLDALPADIRTLAILGDLFAVWIGSPDLARRHHRDVIAALRRLRARGCALLYVEGNHDFFLRHAYADLFDRLETKALDLVLGGRPAHLAHGDLVNRRDRQYLAWRAVSKNPLFYAAFGLLPARTRLALADCIEERMASTNMDFRRGFPVSECETYARHRIGKGARLLVFGHFHEELRFDYTEAGRSGSVFVLPAWRSGRRYLRVDPGAEPAFVSA